MKVTKLTKICTGALALVAASLMTVSCFDDSQLNSAVDDLGNRIDDLEVKIEALETKINSNIKAFEAILAQKATANLDDKGRVILSLEDGSFITVDPATKNTNPILTVVDVDGVPTWAVVDAKGQATSLGAPVISDESFSIRFNKDRKVEYTIDGKNWTTTDIYVSGNTDLFTKIEETETEVVFWIGDTAYPVVKANISNVELLAGLLYFELGQQQMVPVQLQNVKSAVVVAKPEGWKAKYTDGKLFITAPAEISEDIDMTGCVTLWCATNAKETIVAELTVDLALPEVTISHDKDYMITIEPGIDMSDWMEPAYQVIYGACPASEFDADAIIASFDGFVDNLMMTGALTMPNGVRANFDEMGEEISLEPMSLESILGAPIQYGTQYIVWATRFAMDFGSQSVVLDANRFVKHFVSPYKLDFNVTPAWNDLTVDATFTGAKFFVQAYDKDSYNNFVSMASDPDMLEMVGGFFNVFRGESGGGVLLEGGYQGSYCEFGLSQDELEQGILRSNVQPNSTYYFCLIPEDANKSLNDYTLEDVITIEAKSSKIVAGGTCTAELVNLEASYDKATVTVNNTDAVQVLFAYLPQNEFDALEDPVTYIINRYEDVEILEESGSVARMNNLVVGSEYVAFALPVSADGKHGNLAQLPFTTKDVTFSDAISATISNVVVDVRTNKYGREEDFVSATVKVTGTDVVKVAFISKDKDIADPETDVMFKKDLVKLCAALPGTNYSWKYASVPEGQTEFTTEIIPFGAYQHTKASYGYAVAIDKNNNISHVVKFGPFSKAVEPEPEPAPETK